MNPARAIRGIYWSRIRNRLLLFLGSMLVFGGALLWIHLEQLRVADALEEARRALTEARDAYEREVESDRLARQYRADYRRLVEAGFLKDPDRIALLEGVERFRRQRKVPALSLRFEPARRLEAYHGLSPRRHVLRSSQQRLEFSLHHELELDALLRELSAAGQGVYVVEGCRLAREQGKLDLGGRGNVQGQCSLQWLTLLEREGEG